MIPPQPSVYKKPKIFQLVEKGSFEENKFLIMTYGVELFTCAGATFAHPGIAIKLSLYR